ncbi:MAG: putative Ig domain-containing protein [Candidatus Woesearchaeota archaeon]
MVHERFIKKGDKVYGPYLYKSVRDEEGKVKNIYLGIKEKKIGIAILILFSVSLLLIATNSIATSYDSIVILKENGIETERGYLLKNDENSLSLKLDSSNNGITVKGIKDVSPNLVVNFKKPVGTIFKTDIISVDGLHDGIAEIRLKKNGYVDTIFYCKDYDSSADMCPQWEKTGIPFTDNGEDISFFATHFSAYVAGTISILNISDTTDFGTQRYAAGAHPYKSETDTNVVFYANYSNSTNGPIDGNCSIRFNISGTMGSYYTMNYSDSEKLYLFNRSFSYRGNFTFEVNCTNSSHDGLNATDYFYISNTAPYFTSSSYELGGENPVMQYCSEDSICTYNFSSNFTDDDTIDLSSLNFSKSSDGIFDTNCVSINTATGIASIACTTSSQNGTFNLTVTARDGAAGSKGLLTKWTITAVNDAPVFTTSTTLTSAFQDVPYAATIYATDEEDGASSTGKFNFTDNATIFDINMSTGIINFTPTNAMVGNYSINITVNDSNGLQTSKVFSLTIRDTGDAPTITFACDDKLNQAEDVPFVCYVNATDIDPSEVLTFSANYSFFNLTPSVSVINGNASSIVNFTPSDNAVYAHWINITVTGLDNLQDSVLINFTVNNTPDFPIFNNQINNFTLYVNSTFYYKINVTDDDNYSQFGETLYYYDNASLFNINILTGIIQFTPSASDVGTHWVNITVNDSTLRLNTTVINFTIYPNQMPIYDGLLRFNITDHNNFTLNMTINTSDADGDAFTFTDNTTLFNIGNISGILNISANDSYVGANWVAINITDVRGAISQYILNFTIYNINDAPILGAIQNYTNETEGQPFALTVTATDSDLAIPGTTEYLRYRDNSSLFDINPTTGAISFTPGATSNGTYWINITVNDSQGIEDSQVFMINITDAAFPPVLHYVCDNERAAIEDQPFTCIINATDNDTYSELRFTSNYSFFSMNGSNITTVSNAATTIVNFTPNYHDVGNHSINITVTDNLGSSSSRIIGFNVSSVNDAPNLSYMGNRILVVGATFTMTVNATDEENDTLYYYGNTSLFNISLTTGLITFTPELSHLGTHWVNIIVNDSYGNLDSEVVNFSVFTNSAPSCTSFFHTILGYLTPPTNFTAIENQSFGKFMVACNDPEGETFSYNWIWNGTLNKSEHYLSGANWNYNISFRDAGENNLTLMVNDSNNLAASYYWNITVYDLDAPPFLYSFIPNLSSGWDENEARSMDLSQYFYDVDGTNLSYEWFYYTINDLFSGQTMSNVIETWGNATGNWTLVSDNGNQKWAQSNSAGYFYSDYKLKNDIININELTAKIKFISNGAGGFCFEMKGTDCLNAQQVFLNSSSNITYWRNATAGESTQISDTFPFNVTLNADYWLKVRHISNNTLVYVSENGADFLMAYNITYSSSFHSGGIGLFTLNSEVYFDNIVFKDPIIPNITVSLSNNNITFTPVTDYFGEVPIVVTANDGNHTRESNLFSLIIDEITNPQPITLTTYSTSSSMSVQTRVASLDIIVPSFVTLTPLAKTIVPVILNNSGALDLNILDLIASTNASELKLLLKDINFPILKVGQQLATELEITAGLLSPDRYTILIDGNVLKPRLHEQAKIVVDVREKDSALKTQLKEQIRFTRDLFLQNPECLELNELLEQAQKLYDLKQFQQGLDLVQKANEGCKNYIAQERRDKEAEQAGALKAKNFFMENWRTIVIELAALIFAILLLMYYFKRRSFRKAI